MRFSFSSSSPMRTGISYKSRWGRQLSYITDTFCQAKTTLEHQAQADAPPPVAVRRPEADLGIRHDRPVHRVTGADACNWGGADLPRRRGRATKAGGIPV